MSGRTATREAARGGGGRQRIVRRIGACHRGAGGVRLIVACGIEAQVGEAPAVEDELAAVGRRQGGVITQHDPFADQGGRQLEQDAVECDGGVAVDLAGGPGGRTPLPGRRRDRAPR